MNSKNLEMILAVHKGLADLADEAVFIGGAVTEFYADNPQPEEIRPTIDVDIVLEVATKGKYNEFEEKLRALGFKNDISKEAPICRWIYKGIMVDLMPDNEAILGFSNKWYRNGIKTAIKIEHENVLLNIFKVEYYVATKIEAIFGRGFSDLRASHDFEDLIYVFDNMNEIYQNLKNGDTEVYKFILKSLVKFKAKEEFWEAIEGNLPYGEPMRFNRIKEVITAIINH